MARPQKVTADRVVEVLHQAPRPFAGTSEIADLLDATRQTVNNNHEKLADDPRIGVTKISHSTVYYLTEDGEPNIMEQSGGDPPRRDFKETDELEAQSWHSFDLSDDVEEDLEAYAEEHDMEIGDVVVDALDEFRGQEQTDPVETTGEASTQLVGVSLMVAWVSVAVASAAFLAALLSLAPAASFVAGLTSVAAVAAAVFTLALVKVPRFRKLVVGFSTSSVERGEVDA